MTLTLTLANGAALLLLCLGASCLLGAPVDEGPPQAASCADPVVLGAANEALDKINKDRSEGFVFGLRGPVNAHAQKHGENSIVFYLTMNIQETNCSVLSRRHFKNCEVRDITGTPVYGQCKAAVFISRVNRVTRLYKYDCVVRPVAAEKVHSVCPDCPAHVDKDNEEIQKTVAKSLEKFNRESGLSKHFRLLQVTRATAGYGMGMMYQAEFSIQETTCAKGPLNPDACPLMDCEFAHKGFCKGSHVHPPHDPTADAHAEDSVEVNCEIYEPQAAEQEKKLHLLGADTDHSHDDTQVADHGHTHVHAHTHAGHSHTHPHDHADGHVHGHHDNAHDHSHDHAHQHHQYQHAAGVDTHHHDHELALDHAHNHSHLHEHEHHHHHHHHHHHQHPPHKPDGVWRQIPPLGGAVTLPAFPDVPAGPEAGVSLPAKEDPQIPGQMEPGVGPFPAALSPECPLPPPVDESDIVGALLAEDPEFKLPA